MDGHDRSSAVADPAFINYCGKLKAKYGPVRKVLFVQIPQMIISSFSREVAGKKGLYAFPPTSLQYVYEALKDRPLDFRILDLNYELLKRVARDEAFMPAQWLTILEEFLNEYEPQLIGISCMFDSNLQQFIETLEYLRSRDRAIVVIGGIIPTYENRQFLTQGLSHFAVKGEAEHKVEYLFNHITDKDQGNAPVKGIFYKADEDIRETIGSLPVVQVKTDLTASYRLLELGEYYKYGSLNPFSRIANIHDAPYAAIQMNRGCRASCTFCSVRDFMGKDVRTRPVELVLAEMEYLIEKEGVKHFEWLDDDLLKSREDIEKVLRSVIDKKWKITWSANNGLIASSIDDSLMRLIRDSGCIGFKVGVETGNAEMLKKIRKPGTLKTFKAFSRIIQDIPEVFVGGNFMLGFPGEKFRQMLDSLSFYLEMKVDWGAFTLCQKIRGATAFDDFKDYFDAQMTSKGRLVKNFIPTRNSVDGKMATGVDIKKGFDIFKLDLDTVPGEEQIKEIWFSFNLIGNFMHNKNLRPGGRPEKFIAWVEMAQLAYPTNPYMSLFLALAHILKGGRAKAKEWLGLAVDRSQTEYWRERFEMFGLFQVLDNFPWTAEEVYASLAGLRSKLVFPRGYMERELVQDKSRCQAVLEVVAKDNL